MKLIKELFEEAEKENLRDEKSFMTERNKQKLKEQWVLGKFAGNYNKKAQHRLIYAEPLAGPEKFSQNIPDFKVFDSKRNWIFDIEITEALDARRKRTLEYETPEYKTKAEDAVFISETNYLPVIERLISQKCSKDYPRDTTLIIYLNVFSSIYDKFASENLSLLSLPEKCDLMQIWLLDSDGDRILKLV